MHYYAQTEDTVFGGELAAGDLNGDGATDLVVGGHTRYTVFLNDGDGAFTATEVPTTVTTVTQIILSDVTGDGNVDMVSRHGGNWTPGGPPETFVFPGDGAGAFGTPTSLGDWRYQGSGDLNGDGLTDLLTSGTNAIGVSLGNGTGGFEQPITSPIASDGAFDFTAAEVADLTGDGHADVVVTGNNAFCPPERPCEFYSSGVVLTGDGSGHLTDMGLSYDLIGPDITVGDFDEDGHVDVVTSGEFTTMDLWLGDGTGQLADTSIPVPLQLGACRVEAQDVDGDGHQDLVLSQAQAKGRVLFGDGTGQFPDNRALATGSRAGPGSYCNRMLTTDLDGDDAPDVVYLSDPLSELTVLLNELTSP